MNAFKVDGIEISSFHLSLKGISKNGEQIEASAQRSVSMSRIYEIKPEAVMPTKIEIANRIATRKPLSAINENSMY